MPLVAAAQYAASWVGRGRSAWCRAGSGSWVLYSIGEGMAAYVQGIGLVSKTSVIGFAEESLRLKLPVPRISSIVRNMLNVVYGVDTTFFCLTYGPITKATLLCESTWSPPSWESSS